jgi:hypothetical protein
MFYVYKRIGGRLGGWELASRHEDLAEAEKAAVSLCPKGDIETEPGRSLERAFFGLATSDKWSAMIDTKPHATAE